MSPIAWCGSMCLHGILGNAASRARSGSERASVRSTSCVECPDLTPVLGTSRHPGSEWMPLPHLTYFSALTSAAESQNALYRHESALYRKIRSCHTRFTCMHVFISNALFIMMTMNAVRVQVIKKKTKKCDG